MTISRNNPKRRLKKTEAIIMTAAIPTFLYNERGMGMGVVCKALAGSAVLVTGYLYKI